MNSGRLIGIGSSVLGFGVATIAGLWLAVQVNRGELSTGGMLVGALLVFLPVALLIGFGIFMYLKGGEEAERESSMQQQRQMLDIVKSRGQVKIHDLAIEMGTNVDQIKEMVHQLVGLQVFSGYINWDKGVLYSSDAAQLRELSECKNCGAQIELAGKGVVACPYCGTEYFLT